MKKKHWIQYFQIPNIYENLLLKGCWKPPEYSAIHEQIQYIYKEVNIGSQASRQLEFEMRNFIKTK